MKKAAFSALALLFVVSVAVPTLAGCLDCYSVDVPEPDGPGTFNALICLDLAVPTGYHICDDSNGPICFTQSLCYNDNDGGYPRP